jgi:hypothetical protein
MSLVDRWDETSQEQGENTNIQNIEQESWKSNILGIIAIVVVALIALWIYLVPKFATFWKLYIDNPTDTEVTIQIWDESPLTLAPKSHQELELKSGVYSLKVNGTDVGEFKKWGIDWKAFLNPTKSIYIKERAEYVVDWVEVDDSDYTEINIYGNVFYGPFYTYDDYYIEWDWTYGLDEELPDEVDTYWSSTIKTKIYRYDDFVKMYEEFYWDYYIDDEYIDEEFLPE